MKEVEGAGSTLGEDRVHMGKQQLQKRSKGARRKIERIRVIAALTGAYVVPYM